MLNSTYSCDAPDCDAVIPADKVTILRIQSPDVAGGTAEKHLCPEDSEKFMDGTWAGADLFLND